MIKFTWRKLYATIAGWAICGVILMVIYLIGSVFLVDNAAGEDNMVLIFSLLAIGFLGIIFSICMARWINKKAMSMAVKNQQTIQRFLNGEFEDKIPMKWKTQEGRERILRMLMNGEATSVTTAVWITRRKKVTKGIFIGLFLILAPIFKAVDTIISDAVVDCGHAMGGAVANVTGGISDGTIFDGIGGAQVQEDNTWEITQAKNKATFMETQAKNVAMAAPGSYEAKRADNLAKKQRWDANHMY